MQSLQNNQNDAKIPEYEKLQYEAEKLENEKRKQCLLLNKIECARRNVEILCRTPFCDDKFHEKDKNVRENIIDAILANLSVLNDVKKL